MEQLNKEFVFSHIPPRAAESHKGSYGRLLVVAGSRRYRGAAGLAAEGALRSGAGIVTLASVEPVIGAAASRLPDCPPLSALGRWSLPVYMLHQPVVYGVLLALRGISVL